MGEVFKNVGVTSVGTDQMQGRSRDGAESESELTLRKDSSNKDDLYL